MHTSRSLLLLAASAASLMAATPGQSQAQVGARPTDPWAQAASDIPADGNVRFGVLPNGMQYAIMHNATPPGQASFRLRIDAGSLMEKDDQLGLAHFMEHMAFNGTTNIPENELLPTLERHGLALGRDLNASTQYDQTVYMLNLPRTTEDVIGAALHIMREQVSEATMTPAAIDAERGVIEGEERMSNTAEIRLYDAQMALFAPNQLASRRRPIGDLSIVRTAPRERFVEFYNSYYRPSRATFVAVGDFDIDVMEGKIRAAFLDWRPKAPDGPEPDLGAVSQRQPETRIVVDPGLRPNVQISWVRTPERGPDTASSRRKDIVRSIGLSILNRRLLDLSLSDDSPFTAAMAGSIVHAGSVRVTSLAADFEPGEWAKALIALEQEQRRLVTYGVSESEMQMVIEGGRAYGQRMLEGAGTRSSAGIAEGLVEALNEGEVFESPDTRLSLLTEVYDRLTVAEVNEGLKAEFEGEGPLVVVSSPVAIEDDEAAVTGVLLASRQTPVAAPIPQPVLVWPYTDFGAPGGVVEERQIAELDTHVLTFANGVTLYVKSTTFSDDEILISVRTGIGERGLPTDKPSPLGFGIGSVWQGGLAKLRAEQINRVLNGHDYLANLSLGAESMVLDGKTRPADLELEMQVLAAFLTDPGLRPQAFEQTQSGYLRSIESRMSSPDSAFALQTAALLAGGDRRAGLPTAEEARHWTNDDFKAEVTRALANGPIDVIMVGDLTVADAVRATAATFGAMPPRDSEMEATPGADQRRFPAGITEPLVLNHNGPAEQAMGYIAWPTTDQVEDRREARALYVLGQIMRGRVNSEIREKLGIAYAPSVRTSASSAYPGYGSLWVSAETRPEALPTFYAAVDQIAASLRDAPPTEDELDRARGPALEAIRGGLTTNSYWLAQLGEISQRPTLLAQTLNHLSDFEQVTAAEIFALARKYLRPDTAWRASVISSHSAGDEQP